MENNNQATLLDLKRFINDLIKHCPLSTVFNI